MKRKCPPPEQEEIINRFLSPEEQLIVAIIECAIADATDTGTKEKKLYQNSKKRNEARAWLLSDDKSPFSYDWCRSVLHLEDIKKSVVKKRVLKYREYIKKMERKKNGKDNAKLTQDLLHSENASLEHNEELSGPPTIRQDSRGND